MALPTEGQIDDRSGPSGHHGVGYGGRGVDVIRELIEEGEVVGVGGSVVYYGNIGDGLEDGGHNQVGRSRLVRSALSDMVEAGDDAADWTSTLIVQNLDSEEVCLLRDPKECTCCSTGHMSSVAIPVFTLDPVRKGRKERGTIGEISMAGSDAGIEDVDVDIGTSGGWECVGERSVCRIEAATNTKRCSRGKAGKTPRRIGLANSLAGCLVENNVCIRFA